MRVAKRLMLAAWLSLIVSVITFAAGAPRASAHAPYVVVNGEIWSWGANAVHNNVANGTPCASWLGKIITVIDRYGLPSEVRDSRYYPDQAWDGEYMCVDKDAPPVDGGTAIYIYNHCCYAPFSPHNHPAATHAHTFTWCNGEWKEDVNLACGPTFVEDVHLTSNSAGCQYNGFGDCGAHIISHEVGHGLGLTDECGTNDGTQSIMYKNNPPTCSDVEFMSPSYSDKRTAEVCIPWWPWRFPC